METTNIQNPEAPKKPSARVDLATVIGLVIGLAGIIGGLLAEGGRIRDIAQFTAAMIVLGGTAGAVMVSTPLSVLKRGLRRALRVLLDDTQPPAYMIGEVIGYATKARKSGLVSLENEAMEIEDPFFRKALTLAVDGTDLQEIRKMLELEIQIEEAQGEADAKVFESAGGFAPTIGIIGAVMGLIQVMKNLANIDEVGHGIAVAFVATVYGVGSANLLFLPIAGKIKSRVHAETQRKELILEGVASIVEGMNPKLIRAKLEAYDRQEQTAKQAKAAADDRPKTETVAAET